jgi:uncharacterized protein YneR
MVMKTKLLLFFLLFSSYCLLSPAQVPQGFNYQAIARDGTGAVLADTPLTVRITIQTSLTGGTTIWEETHSLTTNGFGAMTFVIGNGTCTGGEASFFSDINWGSQSLFLKTEVDTGAGFLFMGTTKLWTVPYSMAAEELTGSLDKLLVTGKTTSMEEPLFEVKNNMGQTIFAVYNEGVRIYVSDGGTKGIKGGFAIGGFDMNKGVGEYLRVSRDSIRLYLNEEAKTKKGGFAIGSFDRVKGVKQDYLIVDQDSIRMYIKDAGKYRKGGFAIGGFGNPKGPESQYLSVGSDRTNIQVTDTLKGFSVTNIQGGGSSDFMRIDKINSFIGHETGLVTAPNPTGSEGKYNVFIGYQSGNKNTSGFKNVFMGYHAGLFNNSAEHNIFIGNESGVLNLTGRYNTFLGSQSGLYNTASENTFIGYSAGLLNETGQFNTFLGTNSGAFHTAGNYNTFLGWGSGNNNSGANNVFVGASAGSINTGTGNVYIGYNANMAGSNKLLITNSSNTPNVPLIYGEFNNKMVAINKATVTAGYTFWVEGAAGGTNTWNTASDAKLKTNISTISDALSKVLKLRGVNFEWRDSSNIEKGRRMGFIAQEVAPVLPEVVSKSDDTYLMQYGPVAAVIVEAVKEQQRIIIDQQKVIDELLGKTEQLSKNFEELNLQVNKMESLINNQNK